MSLDRSDAKGFGRMIHLQVVERKFSLALIASTAIHAALLLLVLSFTSGSVTRYIQPVGEICIKAFLVSGVPAAARETAALAGRKTQEAHRQVPVAVAPPRETPEKVVSEEKKYVSLLTDLQPAVEWVGRRQEANAGPPAPALVLPGDGGPSGSAVSVVSTALQGGGEFSPGKDTGKDTGDPASQGEGKGMEAPQEGRGVSPPKDADAVPRYGDNVLPAYPPLARLRGYQGVAILFVEVLADGRVGQVAIKRSAGHEILDRTALEAVRTWRFEPGRRDGQPVTMSVAVPVRFMLKGQSTLVRMDDRR